MHKIMNENRHHMMKCALTWMVLIINYNLSSSSAPSIIYGSSMHEILLNTLIKQSIISGNEVVWAAILKITVNSLSTRT